MIFAFILIRAQVSIWLVGYAGMDGPSMPFPALLSDTSKALLFQTNKYDIRLPQ